MFIRFLLCQICIFLCRILDKLKSSSAEAQIQIGRLSEDLSQAKVNPIKLHLHSCKYSLQI